MKYARWLAWTSLAALLVTLLGLLAFDPVPRPFVISLAICGLALLGTWVAALAHALASDRLGWALAIFLLTPVAYVYVLAYEPAVSE